MTRAARPYNLRQGVRLRQVAGRLFASVGPPRATTTIMMRHPDYRDIPRTQRLAQQALTTLDRFLHVEAVSGIVLLLAAAAALLWANLPDSHGYEALWHTPVAFGIGSYQFARSLHFWINDGVMTIFFLIVGMEIRREIHEGALSQLQQAALPLASALGGVAVPAMIYVSLNSVTPGRDGWAVQTATDIAFAVGILALLGRAIPSNVRVFLLALAIIDDIIAVLIIALFYSASLQPAGFAIAAGGLMVAAIMQRAGISVALPYAVPGALVWAGLLFAGVHPTLAGVALGLMTPVRPTPTRERPKDILSRVASDLQQRDEDPHADIEELNQSRKELLLAQRELQPPVVRVQTALHPWVAYGVMPLFALANAGISLDGVDLSSATQLAVLFGVAVALAMGKPAGILGVAWILVKLGWCRLPQGVTWRGVILIGLLAGIGFTMSIFIAMLAFDDPALLAAAKSGVLVGSIVAAAFGLTWGFYAVKPTPESKAADA